MALMLPCRRSPSRPAESSTTADPTDLLALTRTVPLRSAHTAEWRMAARRPDRRRRASKLAGCASINSPVQLKHRSKARVLE